MDKSIVIESIKNLINIDSIKNSINIDPTSNGIVATLIKVESIYEFVAPTQVIVEKKEVV